MKKKKFFSIIVIISILCLNIHSFAMNVAEGDYSYKTVKGYTYRFRATIHATSDDVWAHTEIHTDTNVPTGYMGGRIVIYTHSGSVLKRSKWQYNDKPYSGMGIIAGDSAISGSYYWAQGEIQLFNGNGYIPYITNRTPNVLASGSSVSLSDIYHVNDNNEVYGSEYFLQRFGIKPDLIETIGDNGIIGYVRAEDLDSYKPSNLEEALEYMNNLSDEQKVFVYESDGKTIIDTFTICDAIVEYS